MAAIGDLFARASRRAGYGQSEVGAGLVRHRRGLAHVDDLARPETAVAYDEAAVTGFLSNIGLEVREPPYFGAWSGRRDSPSTVDTW